MSYRADKQVIDTYTHTDGHTDIGDDNTRRPKLASGKNHLGLLHWHWANHTIAPMLVKWSLNKLNPLRTDAIK